MWSLGHQLTLPFVKHFSAGCSAAHSIHPHFFQNWSRSSQTLLLLYQRRSHNVSDPLLSFQESSQYPDSISKSHSLCLSITGNSSPVRVLLWDAATQTHLQASLLVLFLFPLYLQWLPPQQSWFPSKLSMRERIPFFWTPIKVCIFTFPLWVMNILDDI